MSEQNYRIRIKLGEVEIANVFNISPSKLRILTPYIGGAFGCKSGTPKVESIAALLAQKSGRSVRLTLTRKYMFNIGIHRAPFDVIIKDVVNSDGTLIAREMTIFLVTGAYNDHWGIRILRGAASKPIGTYMIPNYKVDAYSVYTNLPLTGAIRGFGATEVEWSVEQQMDIIAEKLGIDPVEIRRKNSRSIGVERCLDKVSKWIGWDEKPVDEKASWKKGKGIAMYSSAWMPSTTSIVVVKVWQDGIIEVRHSATEMGQGINTTLAQIAAEEFDYPIESIRVVSGDTAFCPYDFGSFGSRSVTHNGNALILACQDTKQQLFKIAASELGVTPDDLVTNMGKIYVKETPDKSIMITDLFNPQGIPLEGTEILGRGSYTGPGPSTEPLTKQSEGTKSNYSHSAHAVEVAIHTKTGEIKVLRNCLACDVGRAINPKIIEQQFEGSAGMGIGEALYEEITLDNGKVTNSNFREYHIPSTIDMPNVENSKSIIIEANASAGPFGAKGAGELPYECMSPAIANAVYNAVGVRVKDAPISKWKIQEGIKTKN
jgi:CO/xanthine dehydrogenase Mo-binding subunit